MTTVLSEGLRIARKRHLCFHCGRDIPPGSRYGFQTCKYDHVYTLSWHEDCDALSTECLRLYGYDYEDEGYPGLRERWCDSGEYFQELDAWRGFYPHVICRMELTDQLSNAE